MAADSHTLSLRELGWSAHFSGQLSEAEQRLVPGRVFAVQRRGLTVVGEAGEVEVPLGGRWFLLPPEARPAIGDWVLLSEDRSQVVRLLERTSVLKRRAAGRDHELQLIAANVDVMFLVTSCNEEFNLSRIERYLALALEAGVEPVVVLTKGDLAEDAAAVEANVAAVRTLKRDLVVEAVDARDPADLAHLRAWCAPGCTVALLGSSGVGKSTLINSLFGAEVQRTGDIREDDAKGRHTTTDRSLHPLPDGGLLLDNPGMRELALADVEQGVAILFEDIDQLAGGCRFRDCRHESEPGCAVRAALADGTLDARRLESYLKLTRDEQRQSETAAERHQRFRALERGYRNARVRKDKDEDRS